MSEKLQNGASVGEDTTLYMWVSGDTPNKAYKGCLLKFQVESKWFIFSEAGLPVLFVKSAKSVALHSTPNLTCKMYVFALQNHKILICVYGLILRQFMYFIDVCRL
jgi:hypothetical protein